MPTPTPIPTPTPVGTPGPASNKYVEVVIFENTSASNIYGNTAAAPYLNSLGSQGAEMRQSFAITHPSQPNYLALFSGSTQGTTNDNCPAPKSPYGTNNLGAAMLAKGLTFVALSENLDATGSLECTSTDGLYARKHEPWTDFSNVPGSLQQIYMGAPTAAPAQLTFIVPNLCDDMHNCSISTGDTWASNNLQALVNWNATHDGLLIITWDEDDSTTNANQIATILVGPHVLGGIQSSQHITHYDVMHTIESVFGLPYIANSSTASDITGIWK